MKNLSTVYSDGVNIYVTSVIKSKFAGKALLGVTLLTAIALFIFLLISLDFKEMGKASIPIILIPAFSLFFLCKYLLWNIYGQEFIVINTKTVTYSFDYGFFRTAPVTIVYNKLGIGFRITERFGDENFGRMTFVNYNQETNLPEVIHETAVEITEKIANDIEGLFGKVLFDEYNEARGFSFLEN